MRRGSCGPNIGRSALPTAAGLALLALGATAFAEVGTKGRPTPTPGTWASELDTLARWLDERGHEADCAERCYVLDRLTLSGSVEGRTLEFTLTGAVLADGPVAIPLFGPPDQVRLDEVAEDARPARVGFEGGSYFVFTDSRAFTIRGRLTLRGDLALAIPGPLNSLEANVTDGRLVEGASLSGLAAVTVHFERGTGEEARDEPTVFQLSRAVRVGREITFELHLVMRSGSDLGVVRLPLRHGEEVLEVTGATGWRVEGGTLVVPTAGRSAEVTVTGRLAEVATFAPDERSSYEWWLLESDAEHRVTVEGSGRQFDVSESPIPRTQTSARLFMVQRGQDLRVSVERLASAEVLGAVVQSHDRTVVLTRQGDLVAEDQLRYENNGIDFLMLDPSGRAIYLDTNGRSERIMHKGTDAREVMVPLRTGTHSVKVQSLASARTGLLGGRLDLPFPSHGLTTSHASMTVGLPEHVLPVALLGGERARWFLGYGDAAAVLIGLLAAWLFLRRRRAWLLGGVGLAGLWFVSSGLYLTVLAVLVVAGLGWLLSRLLRGPSLVAAIVGLVAVAGVALLVGLVAVVTGGMARTAPPMVDYAAPSSEVMALEEEERGESDGQIRRRSSGAASDALLGNRYAQQAVGGVLEGVTPVALPLPGYHRSVRVARELVTGDRPFTPVLYYVTSWTVLPLGLLWIVAFGGLAWLNRNDIGRLRAAVGARLARGPRPPPPAPAGQAPPATSAAAQPDSDEPSDGR